MLRFLLEAEHGADKHGIEDAHGHGAEGEHGDDTRNLRIAAVFIILIGSLIGSLPPLFVRSLRSPSSVIGEILRAFAGGVILGLAVIHITPHSIHEYDTISEYPYSGLLILAGIFIMVVTENGLHALYHHDPQSASNGHSHTHSHNHALDHEHGVEAIKAVSLEHGTDPSISCTPKSKVTKVTAWMMEVGCVFHSVIIGIELGVLEDKYSATVALVVALLFHQLIEGISLGSVVAVAGFPKWKAILMVVVYSITTPIGVAIGIGVSETFDPHSRKATIVQGSLDGIAAGLLLYIGLVHLICPDFCSGAPKPWKQRFGAYAALLSGGACMALLAKWA